MIRYSIIKNQQAECSAGPVDFWPSLFYSQCLSTILSPVTACYATISAQFFFRHSTPSLAAYSECSTRFCLCWISCKISGPTECRENSLKKSKARWCPNPANQQRISCSRILQCEQLTELWLPPCRLLAICQPVPEFIVFSARSWLSSKPLLPESPYSWQFWTATRLDLRWPDILSLTTWVRWSSPVSDLHFCAWGRPMLAASGKNHSYIFWSGSSGFRLMLSLQALSGCWVLWGDISDQVLWIWALVRYSVKQKILLSSAIDFDGHRFLLFGKYILNRRRCFDSFGQCELVVFEKLSLFELLESQLLVNRVDESLCGVGFVD